MLFLIPLGALLLAALGTPAVLLLALVDPDALSWNDLRARRAARRALRGVTTTNDINWHDTTC